MELKESESCGSFFYAGRATLQTDRCNGPDGSQVRCVGDLKAGTKQSPRREQECLALFPS